MTSGIVLLVKCSHEERACGDLETCLPGKAETRSAIAAGHLFMPDGLWAAREVNFADLVSVSRVKTPLRASQASPETVCLTHKSACLPTLLVKRMLVR